VDEIMIRFEGRSSGITTIPGKPVPTGLKYFALADEGYIINFECTAPGILEGQNNQDIALKTISIPEIGLFTKLSNTQAVVERLISTLYPKIRPNFSYHLYLDNLFVSWKICYYLRQKGIAVTGTCRKGACGYPPRLSGFKTINSALKWGSLQAEIVYDVLAFLWQDNNAVQGMTTGYTLKEEIEKERKRPKKSSTSAIVARAAFGDQIRKVLPIPGAIEGYNTSMNMVDQANQLRSYFTTLPNRCEKEFFPGVFWSLDFILVNCYKIFMTIYSNYYQDFNGIRKRNSHRQFLEAFIDECFQYTDETFNTVPKKPEQIFKKIPRRQGRPSLSQEFTKSQKTTTIIPLENHKHIKSKKRSYCRCCGYIRRKIEAQKDPNIKQKDAIRGALTFWKCTICGPICKEVSCWNIFHLKGFKGRKRKLSEISI
jgi:hypothetical protein